MEKTFNYVIKQFGFNVSNENKIIIKGYANRYQNEREEIIVDRSRESVPVSAYKLDNYMKNPVLLHQHNQNEVIGKVININITKYGLEIEAEVHKELNPKVFYAIKEGLIRAFSIGFIAKNYDYDEENDIWYWTEVELLEISVVSIPDNQDSLFVELLEPPCQEGVCLMGIRDYHKKSKGEIKMDIKSIKNSEFSDRAWSDVDKTKLGQELEELGRVSYIREAYLVIGDIEKRSTWKFPHHELRGEDLIVNKNGVIAAYQALRGARNNPNISPSEKKKAAEHLLKHYREMKRQNIIDEIPQELEDMVKEFSELTEKTYTNLDENEEINEKKLDTESITKENLIEELAKETGITEKDMRLIILFLNFALYKKDGGKTTFASKYKISNYLDLYNTIKNFKQKYKTDNEREAFSEYQKVMGLSVISRASAWIYNTYLVKEDTQDENKEDLLQARTFAESWFFNSLGVILDNLKKFQKVINSIDDIKDQISSYVGSENYKKDTSTNNKDFNQEQQNTNDKINEEMKNENEERPNDELKNNDDDKEIDNTNKTDTKQNITKEDILIFIEENKDKEEGLNALFDLYTELETAINEALPQFLK